MSESGGHLNTYRVRARNTAAESENRIHDDAVAARFGFRGGLVPGVIVYAYMTVPIVAEFGQRWLEGGTMQVKFHQPFYEGEEVIVRAEVDSSSEPVKATVRAEREDGSVARDGEEITVRGMIKDRFERKGHEFVALDLLLVANESRVVQQVRHTAIYRPRAI
jgi:hypothetical protein